MMSGKIDADFYFDPVSPFAFLMWKAVARDDRGLRLRPVPVVLGGLLDHWGQRGPAEVPPKRLQTYRLCQWLAGRLAIPFRFPETHPFRSLEAMRLLVALDVPDEAVDAVFDAIFVEGRDLGNPAELGALARTLGITDIAGAIADPAVKARLRANGEAAIARGVFGVPTLAVRGELFWGFDALEMAHDYIADPGLFETAEMRRLAALPVGVERKAAPAS